MAMSVYATPFLNGILPLMFSMKTHLPMSYWAFILAGLHLGLHLPVIAGYLKLSGKKKTIPLILLIAIGVYGLFLFAKGDYTDYLLFKTHFAVLDPYTPGVLLLFNNFSVLTLFSTIGLGIYCVVMKCTRGENDR